MSDRIDLSGFADPWLVGYDAHGIQELITASNRPLAMLGASGTITRFDSYAASSAPVSVFAGGGRGVELVDGHDAAIARCRLLEAHYAEQTFGGPLSTAAVPLDRLDQAASLRWLRQRLELLADAARPPGHGYLAAYTRKSDQCADCGGYQATHESQRRDARGERVCLRCHAMTQRGRLASERSGEEIQSLLELAPHGQYLAALSLDGNNLGAFFEDLRTLDDTRRASGALKQVFSDAHAAASRAIGSRHVSLATGGDDIRLFLPQSLVLRYLDALIPELERTAAALAARPPFRGRFDRFGVGVGVVLADAHLPAKRLMEYAHDLEQSAKRHCRTNGPRSAIDFAVLTAGDASRIEPSLRRRGRKPLGFGETWEDALRDAAALARVPSSQRSLLFDEPADDCKEFGNQWRYQVARHAEWRAWYDATGREWRDAEAVVRDRPRAHHLDLLHFLAPDPRAAASTTAR
ncbi:hypothetical protein OV090_41045 [Nannocystis sp. RBIL2]|uniref:Cas10/Cmr2 second palm domain-containing protein n=1 Tax=Nannocystis sp. RBIL2 TaxID=2996788 RepID=UPI00227152B5|nr:hypothetical protein [Nannocystis sp. RBIL2]MCY1071202.1 hypothetical protein [Nannocystis sp. RBIL2]